uniref:tRNA-uridine aminocarboxypropyltransferase 1 n=1 Tax=Ditylenchus dipsaci TaxID=166011 RepID=A0A915E2H8_9BILA
MPHAIELKSEETALEQHDNLPIAKELDEVHRKFSENFLQLESVNERQICNECGRKRIFAPQIQLPVKIDIIKHPLELNAKSTAVHCRLTASTSTAMYDSFDDVPDYSKLSNSSSTKERVVVVYPSKTAVSVEDFVAAHGPIDRFIFLDGTWNNVGALVKLSQLQGLPFVSLKKYRTQYWRPQPGLTDDHLATIEAIYHAVNEHEEALKGSIKCEGTDGSSELSALLFWFCFLRSRVDWQRYRKKLQD